METERKPFYDITVKVTADTAEFEKALDGCIEKMKELVRLGEQAKEVLKAE